MIEKNVQNYFVLFYSIYLNEQSYMYNLYLVIFE
jgi:hypothetical protein